jgi:HEAT repeat protein
MLRRMGDQRAVEPLIHVLTRKWNITSANLGWQSRRAASLALGSLKAEAASEPLKRAINDPNWEVRQAALLALTKNLGEPSDAPAIVAMLRSALNFFEKREHYQDMIDDFSRVCDSQQRADHAGVYPGVFCGSDYVDKDMCFYRYWYTPRFVLEEVLRGWKKIGRKDLLVEAAITSKKSVVFAFNLVTDVKSFSTIVVSTGVKDINLVVAARRALLFRGEPKRSSPP